MWNIIIGLVFIVGGLSGRLALRFTDNSQALAWVGAALLVWGIVQVNRARQQPPAPQRAEEPTPDLSAIKED